MTSYDSYPANPTDIPKIVPTRNCQSDNAMKNDDNFNENMISRTVFSHIKVDPDNDVADNRIPSASWMLTKD